jgi:lon-related putative ATP-dependent protease
MVNELPVEKLRKYCDPDTVGCASSAELSALGTIIGQERAIKALQFGLGIKERGFNMFVAGLPGSGRTTAVEGFLSKIAQTGTAPSDWCYVYNFRDNYLPSALRFPPGQAAGFRADMESLAKSVVSEIHNAFESEEYSNQREATVKGFQAQKQAILEHLEEMARQQNFTIQATPMGLMTIPVQNGKPLGEEEFMALEEKQKQAIVEKQQQLQEQIEASLRQVKGLDKSTREAVQNLDQEVGRFAIRHLVQDLTEKYAALPQVTAYLEQVQTHVIENLAQFKPSAEEQPDTPAMMGSPKESPTRKYSVNVVVDNSGLSGAPVIIERNPTYNNLFGRVEQEARFGTLVTDFTLIRGGSLHRANGGYLVLPAEELLANPLAWESLKRALENREIIIEEAGEKLGIFSTKSLRPQPIPLNAKVILIGRQDVYQLLLRYDERFSELFKVKVDFDTQMPRTEENIADYSALVSTICETENLHHLDSSALARVVEHGSRIVEDQTKLSTHFGEIADVVREASYYASLENAKLVTGEHVRKAIEERFYRSSLIQERIQEMISRDVIKIDVTGERVGQVNGLSVLGTGDIAFGQPSRITVSVGLGREGLIDIEREAKLGGPLHTKGVMILSGYLAGKFSQDKPLSLSARIVFEQNYSGVDGDSASSTELYAILSALSGAPIRQNIAVTGSVDQKGEIQAIGGVNEKIEGFFEVCRLKGLTGDQGVMIPRSNETNLMLKEEVVEAVRGGKFHIWSVETVEEGIEILTGVAAGQREADGAYGADTVFGKVDRRLRDLARTLADFGKENHKAKPAEA